MAEGIKSLDWFTQGSITKRLRSAFDVSAAVILLLGLVSVSGFIWVGEQLNKTGELAGGTLLMAEVDAEVLKGRGQLSDFLRNGNREALNDARATYDHVNSVTVQLQERAVDSDLLPADDIDILYDRIVETQGLMASASLGEVDTSTGGMEPSFAAAMIVSEQANLVTRSLNGKMVELEARDTVLVYWLIAAMMLLAVGGLIVAFLSRAMIRRQIAEPIQAISGTMLKLAEGDRNVEVPYADREDEFGAMARSLAVFKEAEEKVSVLHAERDQDREKQDQIRRQLAESFERSVSEVVSGVAAATSQLQLTASGMAQAADLTASQTNEVSSSLGEASAGVTAAAAASDEFAMSIGEISRQASTSAELARKATDAASEADTTISALSDSAGQVGQVVEMISTIAQRTNLLALNASIEAARGGEAGRGFAVVAAEVKELATQTGKFTEEVADQIRSMQDTTTASVDALRAIMSQIRELEETSISIAAAVDQQSIAGQDLARSIDLAARSTEEVSGNVGQVRETSQSTGSAASQVLSSSTELEQQATMLKSQVEDFLDNIRQSA